MKLLDCIKFDGPSSRDPEDLRAWFIRHQDKTVYELAEAMNYSPQHIRLLRKAFGLNKPNPFHDPKKRETMRRKKLEKGVIPNSIDRSKLNDYEWLRTKFIDEKWTKQDVAHACGVRNIDVHNKLIEFKLLIPNACKNKQWLYEHYIKKKLSTIDCARMAGVYPYTIQLWLYRFGIGTRLEGEALGAPHAVSVTFADCEDDVSTTAVAEQAGTQNAHKKNS